MCIYWHYTQLVTTYLLLLVVVALVRSTITIKYVYITETHGTSAEL